MLKTLTALALTLWLTWTLLQDQITDLRHPLPVQCLGESRPMVVDQQMPYVSVGVGGRSGQFVLDFGATVSSITPGGFGASGAPLPVAGTVDRYDGFDFFGAWGRVQLGLQPHAPLTQKVRQAGVLGTDFLAAHVYTLDYRGGRVYRAARAGFCSDAALAGAGFRALSTRGYYGTGVAGLTCPQAGGPGRCVNVPTLPLRIGPVQAVAQLDTGYDDSREAPAININTALFDALRQAGVALTPRPDIALQLSTCVPGVFEAVEAWQPAPGTALGLVDEQGALLPKGARQVTLFVKRTPAQAAVCGGIGTWARPAAQLGASFVAGGALVVDPYSARVWMR